MFNDFDKNIKPHKFFARDLDLNLEEVADKLRFEYDRIANGEMRGVSHYDDPNSEKDIFTYSKSISTMKSREYNAFQMYYPFVHEIYSSVVDMVREACEYYGIDYNSEQWVAQSWFNINSKDKEFARLHWHDHLDPALKVPAFHGYYSISAEPSETHYNIDGELTINKNINNRAILSLMGYPHSVGKWEWDGDRITMAYDILPLRILLQENFLASDLEDHEDFWEQHYFPLPKIF